MRENPVVTARDAVLRAAGLPAVDLGTVVAEQDDPLVFATVSGAHLYGFPSRDSDVDLRGAHLLPVAALVGLREPAETRTLMWEREGVEMDLVSHDLRKFARLSPSLRPGGAPSCAGTATSWSSCSPPWSCTPPPCTTN